MRLKFEGLQRLWIKKNGHPVQVVARTEFFNGKQPRYCVESETHIPGKNMNQDWINEDQLTSIEPVIEKAPEPPVPQAKQQKRPTVRQRGVVRQAEAVRDS